MKHLIVIICIGIFYSSLSFASDKPVGVVKIVNNSAFIIRGQQNISAQEGLKLFENDMLKTAKDGSIGVIFNDDTVVALGPNSKLIIDEFVFSPEIGKLSFVTRMVRGTASFLTGIIGKLSPESVKVETPVASLGSRGTKFLVRIVDDE